MIRTYRHNGLKELLETGSTKRIDAKFHTRCIEVLDALNAATDLRALNRPAFRLHQLKQFKPVRYSIWVSAQWRITFEWDKGEATRVDFEQYH
ncbi:type II toxin-antitoxin system RelE/ParE family toxin [Bradyrhizobium sp.]|uniref:type II toxin-antitoxin system RelE/ParE family toxin n=1 Tax=Bradyrhizobium sp. TaxID=376 RepID=UPI001ED0E88A|nr:type II toxin-antitoxin system RelE/ParE family toxin [Bradyrhizobium sp.]MBV9984480.1 type II toxin-antitoxin system RelE/ParE family toxin [Bradyrhizobium sp.]